MENEQPKSLEQRVEELEKQVAAADIKFLREVIAKQGGQIEALTSALRGICQVTPTLSETGLALFVYLQSKEDAKTFGALEQPSLDGYGQTADLLREALAEDPKQYGAD